MDGKFLTDAELGAMLKSAWAGRAKGKAALAGPLPRIEEVDESGSDGESSGDSGSWVTRCTLCGLEGATRTSHKGGHVAALKKAAKEGRPVTYATLRPKKKWLASSISKKPAKRPKEAKMPVAKSLQKCQAAINPADADAEMFAKFLQFQRFYGNRGQV